MQNKVQRERMLVYNMDHMYCRYDCSDLYFLCLGDVDNGNHPTYLKINALKNIKKYNYNIFCILLLFLIIKGKLIVQ